MNYSVDNGIWRSVFAVPDDIVDKHIKLCGGASLKVLLVLLRHGGSVEAQELSRMLNLPMPDIQDAFNYWVQLGVVSRGDSVEPLPSLQYEEAPAEVMVAAFPEQPQKPVAQPISQQTPRPNGDEQQVLKVTRARTKLTTRDINQMAQEDQNIAYLLQEGQTALGKPLTAQATEVIVSLYSYYGMAPDLILMLVHYCVTDGRDSVHNIERQAARWIEKGVDTHEKAEQEILRCVERRSTYGRVQSAFGISDRKLVSKEKKFIKVWTDEYGQSADLIAMAYERCVEAIGKLSFDYIGGILKSWHQAGITTPQQAAKEAKPTGTKAVGKASAGIGTASYDIDALERMVTYGPVGNH